MARKKKRKGVKGYSLILVGILIAAAGFAFRQMILDSFKFLLGLFGIPENLYIQNTVFIIAVLLIVWLILRTRGAKRALNKIFGT